MVGSGATLVIFMNSLWDDINCLPTLIRYNSDTGQDIDDSR